MIFNDHSKLEGLHAFLGASNFRWINWDDDKLEQRYYSQFAQTIGTIIHDLAKDLIRNRIKLTKNDKKLIELKLLTNGVPRSAFDADMILLNLLPFVNDAIGFHMSSEVILYYSTQCFGTTDAIGYDEKLKTLRIHDLKNGITPTHMEQLMIYTALFCLEYKIKPSTLSLIELRIYQSAEVLWHKPTVEEVEKFMHMIIQGNQKIQRIIERNFKR